MNKVLKPSDSECYTPSSEPFRVYNACTVCQTQESELLCPVTHVMCRVSVSEISYFDMNRTLFLCA
jgi:hypothetical protein